MATLRKAKTKKGEKPFKLDSHFLPFLQNVPFFAEISRHLRKTPSMDLPTLGVTYDEKTDDMVLYYNPEFMAKIEARKNGDAEIHGVLTHEFYHLVFRHCASRRRTPHAMWNIATDAAINSLIMYNEDGTLRAQGALPPGLILPGFKPHELLDDAVLSEDKRNDLDRLIEKWPPLKASEWYFQCLQEFKQEQEDNCPVHGKGGAGGGGKDKSQGGAGGDEEGDGEKKPGEGGGKDGDQGDEQGEGGGGHKHSPGADKRCTCGKGENMDGYGSFDDHSLWDDSGNTSKDYVDARISDIIRKAVKHADKRSNGWGNIGADMRGQIRASIEHEINWRAELRQWVGTICRGERIQSIKRINKRYPYMFPGVKRAYRPKLLVVGDQSGSVGDDAWELFFGEMAALTRHIDIDVVYFDTNCEDKDIFSWKKGRPLPPRARREKCGGTDFDAPTRMVNKAENRGRWDGVVFMTDGECSKPTATRLKRLWVICPGRKLLFETSDRVITLSKDAPKKGAWR